jgi:hypothetical protein
MLPYRKWSIRVQRACVQLLSLPAYTCFPSSHGVCIICVFNHGDGSLTLMWQMVWDTRNCSGNACSQWYSV